MTRPVLVDLYCGAGGASVGYHRAGFDVIGVDHKAQPRYPFESIQADALEWLAAADLTSVAAIHASPPCQDWSPLHRNYGAPEHGTGWLLAATVAALGDTGKPWVIENVARAPVPGAFVLCGASFGLGASGLDLNRHRRFGTSFPMLAPPCQHRAGRTIGVYGNGTNAWHRRKLGRNLRIAEMREAMGIDWMRRGELSQAIPPAFTEYVGALLLEHLRSEVTE